MEILLNYLPFICLWSNLVLGTPLMQTKQGAEATEIFKSELQHDLQTDSFHTLNQSPISAKLKSREVETRKVPELFPNIQLMSLYEQGLQVGECRCRKKREYFKLPLNMNSISYKQAGMLQSVEKESLLLWYEWDATCREELGIRKPLSQPTLASMEAEMRLHAYEAGGRVGTCICNKSLIPRDAAKILQDNPVAEFKEDCEKSLFKEIEQRRARIISLVKKKQSESAKNGFKQGRRKADKKLHSENHSGFAPDISRFKHAISRNGSDFWRKFTSFVAKISRSQPAEAPRAFGHFHNAPMGFVY